MASGQGFVERETIIKHDLHALIRLPSTGLRIVELKKGGIVSLGKFGIFDVDEIVGYPFGQSFEVLDNRKVRPINSTTYGNNNEEDPALVVEEEEITASEGSTPVPTTLNEKIDYLKKLDVTSSESNRELVDIGSSTQSLSMDEIETLKKTAKGANVGEAIIDKLIKSHVNFNMKTKHSQEKYLIRKQQKFLRRFTVDYVGPSELLQYFIEKDSGKVLDMSEESLGLILSLGNIQAGGRYLVIDETGGVVIAAIMERMRGLGEILVVHENEHPNHSALSHTEFSIELQKKMIQNINLLQFLEPEEEKVQWNDFSEEELKEMKTNKRSHYYRRKQNAKEINSAIENSQRGEFDGLIIASTLYTPTLINKLLEKVSGSRPIIIYSQFKEGLVETQVQSLNDLRLLAPTIHESKCRPYQTIPGRLHPMMSMRGGGGYVFSALRVYPIEDGVQAVGRGLKKRKVEVEGEGEEQTEETPEVPQDDEVMEQS
jgi:tRNA (adenine-N(1)-)-methyltransferase non-catalytic subunit